ncbi:MAG TPA: rhomboid family intramembrane serine protease, partial [Aquihabitans sp.]|nr:rhomboid family intramembrane serine protease [Aquihabitans sp.]
MTDAATDRPELDLSGWARPFVVVAALVAAMWAVELVDLLPGTRFDTWGIRPRQAEGLVGVGAAPFLHDGLPHLVSNTIPFLVLGGAIAASGIVRWVQVTLLVAAVCGVGTWLVGPGGTTHIGASGIVFGYLTYLLARGLFEHRAAYLLVGALALFLYGGVLWGLLPRPGVSWQGHAFGALGGVVAARLLHAGAG